MTPTQQKVVEEIEVFGKVLDRVRDPRWSSAEGKTAAQLDAKSIAESVLKEGASLLVQAAHEATLEAEQGLSSAGREGDDGEASEALQLLAQFQAAAHTVQVMADLALGMIPFVGGEGFI